MNNNESANNNSLVQNTVSGSDDATNTTATAVTMEAAPTPTTAELIEKFASPAGDRILVQLSEDNQNTRNKKK